MLIAKSNVLSVNGILSAEAFEIQILCACCSNLLAANTASLGSIASTKPTLVHKYFAHRPVPQPLSNA